jgi:hypothetical protein
METDENRLVRSHRTIESCYLRSITVEYLLANKMQSVEMRFLRLISHLPIVK